MVNKRTKSSRRYEVITCKNPNCLCEGVFQPTDKRQLFCEPQCRINFFNDVKSSEDSGIYLDAKKLKAIDKKLGKMYDIFSKTRNGCYVHKDVLMYEDIDIMLLVKELEMENKQPLKSYFRYGLTIHLKNNDYFIIHKLKK